MKIIKFPEITTKRPPEKDKSCFNCAHYEKKAYETAKCGHYPNGSLHTINNTVCTSDERQLWSEKKGLTTRFIRWLL